MCRRMDRAGQKERGLLLTTPQLDFLIQELAAVAEGLTVGIEEGLPLGSRLAMCERILDKARNLYARRGRA